MDGRYIVVCIDSKYSRQTDRFADMGEAINSFQNLSRGTDISVILYDSQNDLVKRFTIKSEPILLAKAITSARRSANVNERPDDHQNEFVINLIAEYLDHKQQPNDNINTVAPYYSVKDLTLGSNLAGAGVGVYGALSGGVLGFLAGGPVGAVVGVVVGGVGLGGGTKQLVKKLAPPDACRACRGTGLVDNLERCKNCGGLGHK